MSQKATYKTVSFIEPTERGTYLVRDTRGQHGFVEPYRGQQIPETGKHLQVQVLGYSAGGNTFFGRVRTPKELASKLQGAYLNCEVVGTGRFGDPKVQAYGNGTNIRGFVQNYPLDITPGQSIKVRVIDVRKRQGVPHLFVADFVRAVERKPLPKAIVA